MSVKNRKKILLCFIGNVVCSMVHCMWMIYIVSTPVSYETCVWLGKSGGIFYVASNFFTYSLLHLRAKTVAQRSAISKIILDICYYFTLFGVLPLALIAPALFRGKLYFKEQYCVQELEEFL